MIHVDKKKDLLEEIYFVPKKPRLSVEILAIILSCRPGLAKP